MSICLAKFKGLHIHLNMTMLLCALVLCLALWSAAAVDRSNIDYAGWTRPATYTSWGSYGHVEWCPEGSYAYGFALKVEKWQGKGDDTALNGIKLLCRSYSCGTYTGSITGTVGGWGTWTSAKKCLSRYFMRSVELRSEPKQGSGDDTAANNYEFTCQNTGDTSRRYLLTGAGSNWGRWTGVAHCPGSGSYICGIRTQVEAYQGSGDDSALNNARFYCCYLRSSSCGWGRRR